MLHLAATKTSLLHLSIMTMIFYSNLEAGEEYYMRKTRRKNNILHLSLQLQHFTIKNKKGVSAANLITQCSEKFQTLVKNKIESMDKEEPRNDESLRQIEFSIKSTKVKLLHKRTPVGNMLFTLLITPKLICQLNYRGQTALHLIARNRPWLMIKHCYKLIKEEEDVEELCYDPPWTVKDRNGNTNKKLPGRWLDEILKFDYDFAKQVNNKGELPLHVLLKKVFHRNPLDAVFHRNNKRTYVDKVYDCDIIHFVNSLCSYNDRACHINDKEGLTPLFIAAQAKELQCFDLLLRRDFSTTCDGDHDDNTFWHHLAHVHDDAVIFDHSWHIVSPNIYNALIQRNKSGKTPFHLAIENANFKVANLYFLRFLPDDKRHLVYKDMGDKDGNVPLHLVVGRSNLPFAQEFIQHVTTPTELIAVHNNIGLTPLHLAVLKQDFQFLNIIFDLKRDDKEFTRQILQTTDRDHNTPLHYAISQGLSTFAEMFFNKGVWAECIDEILGMSNKDGNRPLHFAVLRDDSSLATKFIDRAKENNFIQGMLGKHNNEGNTALHLAFLKGKHAIAEIFIKTMKENSHIQGILDKGNNEGNTPTHLAIQNREFNLVKGFIEYAIERVHASTKFYAFPITNMRLLEV